ncbi:hypothetical protein ACPC54_07415 [Kitasatospora sp. NPDC094028]
MSPVSRSARGLSACPLLLALALPLLGVTPAVAVAPVAPGVVRPVPPCAGDDADRPHHRPLPPPGLVTGEPVRRAVPSRPCL